jgi:Ca2+-dependent lipid-binding protein
LLQDIFGSSDPFLRFSRVNEDSSSVPVYKTAVVMRNLNPSWRPVTVSMQQLCNGDPHRPLLIECFDWNKSGSHELIGAVTTSLHALSQAYVPINARLWCWLQL